MFQNPDASVCRLLDHGMLQGFEGQPLEFMCLEYAGWSIHDHLAMYTGTEHKLRCCHIALMTLKGVYDIHREGLLHRDLKPDNMGLLSREQPIVVIYDLGMARMYTDSEGKVSISFFILIKLSNCFFSSFVPTEVRSAFVEPPNGHLSTH